MTTTDVALARMILLCQGLAPVVPADAILRAFTETTISIVADHANLASGACQSAIVTLSQLAMQMGVSVNLVAPDVELEMPQPPWRGTTLMRVLEDMASDSVPGVMFLTDEEIEGPVFVFGDTESVVALGWRVSATRWSGAIQPVADVATRLADDFPMGGLAAALLAAAETFKFAMRKLDLGDTSREMVASAERASIRLNAEDAPIALDLGQIDCVSGGAIVQATLHALLRVPGLHARVRVIEPERLDATNLNRYSLSRRSRCDDLKIEILEEMSTPAFSIEGVAVRFDEQSVDTLVPLAPVVLVGVDHIPSRWFVQKQRPGWLVVGATSQFLAMASEHDAQPGCAGCVHPSYDGVRADIPTVAFTSYAAGLLVAARVMRHAALETTDRDVVELHTLRLDSKYGTLRRPVTVRSDCPVSCYHPGGAHLGP